MPRPHRESTLHLCLISSYFSHGRWSNEMGKTCSNVCKTADGCGVRTDYIINGRCCNSNRTACQGSVAIEREWQREGEWNWKMVKRGGVEERVFSYTDTTGTRAHWVAVRIIVLFEQLTRRSKRGDGFCRLAFCAHCADSHIYTYIYIYQVLG